MNDRIRVLHLARPAAGGMRRHLADLLSRSDSSRCQHFLACPASSPVFEDALATGIVSFPVSVPGSFCLAKTLRAAARFRHVWRQVEPDILHLHGWQAALAGRLSVLISRSRPRIVITAHNYVPVAKHSSFAFRCSEGIFKPVTDHIIAVSKALRDDLAARFPISSERICVIHNGIDFTLLPERKRVTDSPFRIGTVARLSPEKGVDTFIKAVALLPGSDAVVVGDGPCLAELANLAENSGVAKRIRFTGQLTRPGLEVATWDAFVLPSNREAFGIALVEAMGQGIPVIGTRVGGIPEIIEDGVTGLLVKPGDPEAIADAIRWIAEHPTDAALMAESARLYVRQQFDVTRMVRDTECVYTTVVSGRIGSGE